MGVRQGIVVITFCRSFRKLLPVGMFCFLFSSVHAQTPVQIIDEIKAVNNKVANTPCNTGNGMLISNKAMNIFLSNKVSSYLSDNNDLSLYKNYVTLNAAEGSIAISHNFHQPVDSDDWVRSFLVMGARVNVANTYAARFSNKYLDNRLGFTLQKTWMGRPVTYYDKCGTQKFAMDAQRAVTLHSLELEINKKAADFEQSLTVIKSAELPGQNMDDAKKNLRKDFYSDLRLEYLQKFSEAQSDDLIKTNNFNLITDNWTTVGVYVPIIRQKFEVSTAMDQDVTQRYNYPAELYVTHTRFWESPKYGRFFLSFNARAFYNNSVQSGGLLNADVAGNAAINQLNTITVNNGNRYIGDYKNYITPTIAGKIAYIPPDSHVGVSFRIEKNFGTYNALNSILGIPIVLIDKNGVPAINFEAQLLFADMGNSIKTNQLPYNKTAVGLTVGIPFSKIVY